ncbi:MAG: NAD(P)-binding domain-containing protein [Rhodovarius sp.]|nr:NAD(P)-binding domain-containing protein [Rhodovarius sp.]MCX7932789.1 NAD(P)-binding domain-containing protein [Rhodovarius sp.]MDW8315186.1 NAD(P)-binding domain-containing protein [Rhodovarius sp.]
MNQSTPLGLAALEQAIRRDLELLCLPAKDWVPPRPGVIDVLVVGAGMNGIAAAGLLRLRGVRNTLLVDAAAPGREGPWRTYARMETLRSPKNLPGPCLGLPNLTYRAWHEARFGTDDWEALYKIPNGLWQEYLSWLQRVLALPIRHGVRVVRILPQDGLLRVETEGAGTLLARRVVLATGRGGVGGNRWPETVPRELWPDLAFHTNEERCFAALAGKSVGIIGAGASGLDAAAAAMEAGAREACVYARRQVLPQVNKGRGAGIGFHYGWGELDDADRWALMVYLHDLQPPPPHETIHRVLRAGAQIHLGFALTAAEREGEGVRLFFANGEQRRHDVLILGTGFAVDLDAVPELAAFAPHIARWADRYTPPPELVRPEVAAFPYLGPGFELLPRSPAAPPELSRIHLLNYGAHCSFGGIASDIPAVTVAAERLVLALMRALFREEYPALRAGLEAYDVPELAGTPFHVPGPGVGTERVEE